MALREIVPAATFDVRLADDPERRVTVATVLPMAWPAMVRADGTVFLGLQVGARSGDVSRDLAVALEQALASPPGSSVTPTGLPAPGRRLQDLLTDGPIEVHVQAGFDFWLDGTGAVDDEVRASLERANSAVVPTTRLPGVTAAYWCRMPERNHLRWVLGHDEEPALDALARLFAADGLTLGPSTRYIGSFRAHGLVVPVWDLASSIGAGDIEEPVARLARMLDEAVADPRPLSEDELRARRALAGRQVTIR